MPSFQAWGYRFRIGSDDLGLPSLLEATGHAAWMGCVATIFYKQRRCSGLNSVYLHDFYIGGMLLTGVNLGVLASLIRVSLKGTLINPHPRRSASILVGIKCCMNFTALLFSLISTRWAYYTEYGCEPHIVANMQQAVKGLYMITAASFYSMVFILAPRPYERHRRSYLEMTESSQPGPAQEWLSRFKSIGRILGMESDPVITEIATLFTDLFKNKADIVLSDVMVALMLLEADQKIRRGPLISQVIGTIVSVPPHHARMRTWMTPQMAAHYIKFAIGCYGWRIYTLGSPLGLVQLFHLIARGRYIPRALPTYIEADNSLLANTTAIKMLTGITDDDIVYATFHNKLYEIPFYVALDHVEKSVVVAIRGTLSLEDVLTDLMAVHNDKIHVEGVPRAAAHHGMLATARYIFRKLTGFSSHTQMTTSGEMPLLEMAHTKLVSFVGPHLAKKYDLVVVGHSLGAGVAAILSILLHEVPCYAQVKCFAFSPPGGLLSQSMAEYAESFVCSVVLGDDIVSRLSLRRMYELKIKILQILQTCDIKKHEVIGSWMINLISRILGLSKTIDLNQRRHSWDKSPAAKKVVEQLKLEMQRVIENTETTTRGYIHMYPPGCIMYIDEQKIVGWLNRRVSYRAVMTTYNSVLFQEVLLSPDMLRHHSPWNVLTALRYSSFNL